MHTVLEILRKTTDYFTSHGVPAPRLDAELLVAHVLGVGRMQLYLQFERPIDEPALARLRPLVKRRAKREPLQHLLGTVSFDEVELNVDARALIPRPETEYLIELACSRAANPPPESILDLGTGSGAIALALAKRFPEARLTATDRSEAALELARTNAEFNQLAGRVRFLSGDWFAAIPPGERFDWILSNPPYLSEEEWKVCEPEVRDHDPKESLVAPDNGIADARRILHAARNHLNPQGWLFLEVGITHPQRLAEEALAAGYTTAAPFEDLTRRPRFLIARHP
jgi:release factor glutamine methyltransferase